MSFRWVLRKKGESEMDIFKNISSFTASRTNPCSLPFQTNHQVVDREEILKIQAQIFKYHFIWDGVLWSFNKTYIWGLLSSVSRTQYENILWGWAERKHCAREEPDVLTQSDFAPGHTGGENYESLAQTLLWKQTINPKPMLLDFCGYANWG